MWFVGLLLGAALGSIGGIGGALVCGFMGAVLMSAVGRANSGNSTPAANKAATTLMSGTVQEPEARIAALEDEVKRLTERMARLEAGSAVVPQQGGIALNTQEPVARSLPAVPEVPQPVELPAFAESPPVGEAAANAVLREVKVVAEQSVPAVGEGEVPALAVENTAQAPSPAVSEAPAPAQAAPATPIAPREPSAFQLWWRKLVGGNIVAKVGVVVLFFGVSFLLKYAYDHALLPPPLRLAGVACAGIAMLVVGWRLKATRRLYGLILQGGGIGVLYLDVFFALKVFGLLDATVAFALFMLLGVAATLLAVRQDARVLAVLGLTGAFLAPILASRGGGSHVLLFSYYTLLNVFILLVSWFKSWRELNITGFVFTFVVGLAWGANNYTPDKFATVEPFVLLFFGIYLLIPVLFALRQPPHLKGLVDGTLVFGTPLGTAFMQASLVHDMPHGLTWSAAVACGLYALLAAMTIRRGHMRLLGETYSALSVVLGTLAIFFGLDAYPTFALWTLEGAAVVWVGLRQRRLLARVFGLALQGAGAVYFLLKYGDYALTNPWFNDFTLGCVLIAVSGCLCAVLMHRHREALSAAGQALIGLLLVWAGVWWAVAAVHACHHALATGPMLSALLAASAFTFLLIEVIGTRLHWRELRLGARAHLPVLAALAVILVQGMVNLPTDKLHPFSHLGWVVWPMNFGVLFWVFQRQIATGLLTQGHAGYFFAWVLIAVLATWEAAWLHWHDQYRGVIAWAAAGVAVAWLRFVLRERGKPLAVGLSGMILWWSLFWWFAGAFSQIPEWLDGRGPRLSAQLAFCGLTFAATEWLGARFAWERLRALNAAHLPMVMVFAAVWLFARNAHPFEYGGFVTWPLNFAVLFWCMERRRAVPEPDRYVVQFVLCWVLMLGIATVEAVWSVQHERFIAAMLLATLGGAAAWLCHHKRETGHRGYQYVGALTFAWALLVWAVAGLRWVYVAVTSEYRIASTMGFVALSVALFEYVGHGLKWAAPRLIQLVLLPVMLITLFVQWHGGLRPFEHGGWVVWPLGFAVLLVCMARQYKDAVVIAPRPQYVAAIWVATAVVSLQLIGLAVDSDWGKGWVVAAAGAPVAGVILLLTSLGQIREPWRNDFDYYVRNALGPLALYGLAWSLMALADGARVAPFPYIPLINAVDLAQLLMGWALWRWCQHAAKWRYWKHTLCAWAFVVLNAVVLRAIHHGADVAYTLDALLHSTVVQTAFSLLWSITAFALMLTASRKRYRYLWFTGATLLAVVVAKLFLFDLANTGTVARIVSFMGVGGLLLLIGYKVPVPPGEVEAQQG